MSRLSVKKMAKIIKKITIVFLILATFAGSFFYFSNRIHFSRGKADVRAILKIEKGEDAVAIGKKLEQEGLISNYIYFVFYVWDRGLRNQILAGEYEIAPELTIPEIAKIITQGEIIPTQVKLTFPEGWTAKEMELRIKNNLPAVATQQTLQAGELRADDFNSLANQPSFFQGKYGYDFLGSLPEGATLEGFLFPDTYFFSKDATAEEIIQKMLDNFGKKISADLRQEIEKQGKNIHEIITMASVIEGEVRSDSDRKIVSGIFWDRIKNGQALQSCATLAFVLGENKKQYSFEDTRTPSPYNTYLNKGLPPGPISNPGLAAITAAIYPTETNYNYFLSDPETGETIFSRTLDEHNANKVKYGL